MTATRNVTLGAAPAAPAVAGAGGRFAAAHAERAVGEESGVAGSAARATPASPQGAVPLTRTADRQTPNIPRRAAA
ncbi:hypothetical protein OOK36_04620 [Streptomyces sp. NBC_00365]|uniref:hypothetical protein n=1 Tax=Streptomyces sp. NBC_00365 TaxID=2975726 RepID=UPI002252B5EC|nr:hypothetical protein [Streptomyces sp. NBC_00365]MCX5088185.1 hypothetical protein [Streptomyces sp. NBC_00365]